MKNNLQKNYLDIIFIPEKSISWKEEEDLVILDVENKGFFNRIAQKFFGQPKISHISLDKYGSTLWKLLDGENTVFQIVKKWKKPSLPKKIKCLIELSLFYTTCK